jgi:hypothetical protein
VVIEVWTHQGDERIPRPKHQALPMLLSIQLLFEWFRTGPTAIHDCAQERNDTASQLLHAHHTRQDRQPRLCQDATDACIHSSFIWKQCYPIMPGIDFVVSRVEFQCELACKQVDCVSSSPVKTHQSLQFPSTTKHMNPQTIIPSHQCTQLGINGINGHQVEEVRSNFFAIVNENLSSPVNYSFCATVTATAATMHTTIPITVTISSVENRFKMASSGPSWRDLIGDRRKLGSRNDAPRSDSPISSPSCVTLILRHWKECSLPDLTLSSCRSRLCHTTSDMLC